MKKITTESFKESMFYINPRVEILGEYITAKTHIDCACNVCGYKWSPTPDKLKCGTDCPRCEHSLGKTHAEFVKEVEKIRPNIKILGTYVDSKTKVLCKDNNTGIIAERHPSALLRKLVKKKKHTQKLPKYTAQDFVEKLKIVNPNIELISDYINTNTRARFKCKIDGWEWETIPTVFIRKTKSGCPKCAGNLKSNHSDFIQKLSKVTPTIEILNEYVRSNVKVLCHCKECGHEWRSTPNKLLQGRSCPSCAVIKRGVSKTIKYDIFQERIKDINLNIILTGNYLGVSKKTKFKCLICGHVWEVAPTTLLTGVGCPECAKKKMMKTNEQFLLDLHKVTNLIEPLEAYMGSDVKIKCKCLREGCGNIWMGNPHSMLRGAGCPKCNTSLGEIKILNYLLNNNINHEWTKEFAGLIGTGGGLLSYDFYLPNYNLLIEYQGEFHDGAAKQQPFSDFLKQVEHDKRKKEYAEQQNIQLLEIWYWDFDNIDSILKNTIRRHE